MIAAKIANMRSGARTDLKPKTNLSQVGDCEVSIEDAANHVNVSKMSVKTARRVQKNCDPELCDAVSSGEIKVSDAAKAVGFTRAEQKRAVAMVKKGSLQELDPVTRPAILKKALNMVQRFKVTILLLVVLLFSIQPALADEIEGENTEPKNYCNDPKTWAIFENLCAKYPNDEAVQTLHALRIGLCKKVADGSITLPLAVDIFDRVHQIVLKMKRAEKAAEAGPEGL